MGDALKDTRSVTPYKTVLEIKMKKIATIRPVSQKSSPVCQGAAFLQSGSAMVSQTAAPGRMRWLALLPVSLESFSAGRGNVFQSFIFVTGLQTVVRGMMR